ncbi:MAG: hypothetical protein ABIF77_01495 [bacterium]
MAFWSRKGRNEEIALTLVSGNKRRDISVRELAVGNKLAADALLAVLVEKGLVDAVEVRAKLQELSERNFRPDPSLSQSASASVVPPPTGTPPGADPPATTDVADADTRDPETDSR